MKVTMNTGSTPGSFHKEWEHPELGEALKGSHESAPLRGPVSGPNPKLKTEGSPVHYEPAGAKDVPEFMMKDSYMGEWNKEAQGKSMKDIPLNDFNRTDAHIGH